MKARFAQVRLRSVKLVFTTKNYEVAGGLPKEVVRQWKSVGPREVRDFVWPKVTIEGPEGVREYSLTWLNPHARRATRKARPTPPGKKPEMLSRIEKVFLNAALGKAQRIPEEARKASMGWAERLRLDIEARVMSACRAAGLTAKVRDVWRKTKREGAYKDLYKFLDLRFDELSDYDVREAWRNVKRARTVRTVLDA